MKTTNELIKLMGIVAMENCMAVFKEVHGPIPRPILDSKAWWNNLLAFQNGWYKALKVII